MMLQIVFTLLIVWNSPRFSAPGAHESWTTPGGYVWSGHKWFQPDGAPSYPLRPVGTEGLWNDGVAYDSPISRKIQQWEREAAQ